MKTIQELSIAELEAEIERRKKAAVEAIRAKIQYHKDAITDLEIQAGDRAAPRKAGTRITEGEISGVHAMLVQNGPMSPPMLNPDEPARMRKICAALVAQGRAAHVGSRKDSRFVTL